MRSIHVLFVCSCMLALSACGRSEASPGVSALDPASLCVSSQCGTKTKLVDIPGAENTLFTPDGRLFVSGTQNTYEITKDSAGFHATPLFSGTGTFMGMALVGQMLYVACSSDMQLYAADLSQARPSLSPIYQLSGFSMPNGMTAGPSGELYLVDGPLSPKPKIVRIELSSTDPTQVTLQDDWLPLTTDFPNGLTRVGSTLYITQTSLLPPVLGEVVTVTIQADGTPGPVQNIGNVGASLPDDIAVVGNDELVALYSEGAIALIGDGGVLSQTDALSFSFPSSVKLGEPPMFAAGELIITEKGPLGVSSSLLGNDLCIFQKKEQ